MDRLDKAIEIAEKCNKNCRCSSCNVKECKEMSFAPSDILDDLKELDKNIIKEPSIQLKNIDLTGVTNNQQLKKLYEKFEEFRTIMVGNDKDNSFEHACKELFDAILLELGCIQLKYNKTADEVMAEYPKHIQKMQERGNKPREKV